MNMFVTVSALALASMDPGHAHEHAPQLGTVSFETSCSPAAVATPRTLAITGCGSAVMVCIIAEHSIEMSR